MAGFGSILGGFGKAYPQYQQQQQEQQMNQFKLRQAMQQMALEDANRKAQGQALQSFSGMQGSGPAGTVTPQQLAQAAGGNMSAFQALNNAQRPSIQGMYNLAGKDLSGQYGLQRTQMSGDNAMNRVDAQQEGANTRNEANIDSRQSIVGTQQQAATGRQKAALQAAMDRTQTQQTGANQRNQLTNTTKAQAHANSPSGSLSPQYRTAKAEYDEATRDEQSIQNNYGRMGNFSGYLNDPEWTAARKRKVAAQTKLDGIADKQQAAAKEQTAAAQAPAAAPQIPPEVVKLLQEGTKTTFKNGQTWTLQNGQPVQVQ